MNIEYSPKERFDKIVEILAEGVIRLVREKARFFASASEWLADVRHAMIKDKRIASCCISSSQLTPANLQSGKAKQALRYYKSPDMRDVFDSLWGPGKSSATKGKHTSKAGNRVFNNFEAWDFPDLRKPSSFNIKIKNSGVNDLYYTESCGKIRALSHTITCD